MNNRKALTKEEIQFYTQRRKQYTQDFLLMSKKFDPKLKQLTKLLIARKQMTAPTNSFVMPQNRKCKVFASMTKSIEIQQKIDQGMKDEACKYSLDPMPKCRQQNKYFSFEYQDICARICSSMVPIVSKIDKNIQNKIEDIETDKLIKHRPSIMRCDTRYQDELVFKDEYIDQMQIKSQRLHNIIGGVSILQRTKAYQDYNKRKSLHHRPLHLQSCSEEDSEQVSDNSENEQSKRDYEALVKFEKWKLKDQIEKDKAKSQRLQQYVQEALQRLGLQKKMFSMKELQEYIQRCQKHTDEAIKEYKSEQGGHKPRKSMFLQTMMSTKQNTYSNTQSRYKTQYNNTNRTDEGILCKTEYDQQQTQKSDLLRLGQLSLFNMNKVKGRYNNFRQKFKKATNHNLY